MVKGLPESMLCNGFLITQQTLHNNPITTTMAINVIVMQRVHPAPPPHTTPDGDGMESFPITEEATDPVDAFLMDEWRYR